MVISRKMQFSTFEPSLFTFEPAGTFYFRELEISLKNQGAMARKRSCSDWIFS
jgi:hypothetical protein